MPLIVLCGQPCSGKSSTAHQLKHKLEQLGREVTIIDEPSLHLDRNNSYSKCGDAVEVLDAIVHNMTAESERELGNTQQQVSKELSPTVATSNPSLLATNTLHDIDQAAQDVINVIMDAQTAAAGAAAGSISVADQARPLDLAQVVTLAELRRHKRAFLKLATKSTFTRIQDPATARRMFADYLRDNIGT